MEDKKISIVVLNWNNKEDTLDCLRSLTQLKVLPNFKLETIVSDNGSTDGSVEEIKKEFPHLLVLENNKNLGFSEGNNVAIKKAQEEKADFVLILNNDTLVDPRLVVSLLDSFLKDKNVGISVPKIYFAKGFEYHKDRYQKEDQGKVIWYAGGGIDWQNVYSIHFGLDEVDHGQFSKAKEVGFASGCCQMVKREVFEKVGFFDRRYFLYLEDMDFSQRVKEAGYKIVYNPKAVIWHKNAQTTGGPGSLLHDYYITRNRLLFGFRYAPLKTKSALLKEAFLQSIRSQVKRQALFDFLRSRFGQGNISGYD